ncbi:ABC transporter permease [Faecalicatena contorta]|uniref:Ribose transport system permease protein n=1 Tax=Faecalicatena contorta TaxID=39482 RepID=A0A316A2P4_9FIRM|nr:ABC transporter permease [Faecalicatena contorta]PWJ51863.1 ribose transport system permease protein [Faecalicatena contorta]SUQ12123.1 ribose transport system permease protein [Faecalicatena contorta]
MGKNKVMKVNENSVLIKNLKTMGILWALILVCIIAAIISPNFLRPANVVNVVRSVSLNGIIAMGMTFVVLTGGVDLSVGSIVGVVAVSAAMMMQMGIHPVITVVASLLIGSFLGLINGIGVTRGKLAPFIMTLGTMTALRGVARYIANGSPQNWNDSGIDFSFLGQGSILGVPVPVYIFLAVFLIAFYVLKYTECGRSVYALGDSREAARLCGIHTKRVETMCFVITGFLSALSAIIFISRLGIGQPEAGEGYELDALAMVYIGGASTAGGSGSVVGTLVGACLISVISNILNLMGISPFIQKVIQGVIIILAVLLERRTKKN